MRRLLCLALLALLVAAPARAAVEVFACEPEWGALAREIGGDKVSVFDATTGKQDPHRIEARPSLLARMRNADLVVCTGAELEIGWLPLLLRQTGNPRVQPGRPGFLEAASHVDLVEVPTALDRALGDVHAFGNPHIQTDPRNFVPVARQLASRLASIDTAHAEHYRARLRDFLAGWGPAIARWEARAAPLRGTRVIVRHKNWTYLTRWLGLVEVAALEPKPGIEPSTTYLAQLLDQIRVEPAWAVIHAAYENDRPVRWIAERAHITVIELPFTIGGTPGTTTLISLFDQTIERLLAAAPQS